MARKQGISHWFLSLVSLLLSAPLFAEEKDKAELDPNAGYRADTSNPVTYSVDLRFIVTPPYKTNVLKVWVPIPPTDAAQEVSGTRFATFPLNVEAKINAEPKFGNKFAYFEFDHPEGAQIIEHRFQIKTWELNWNVDPDKVARVAEWPSAFEPYLHGERQSVVVDDRFRKLGREIVLANRGPAQDLASLFAWVHQNFRYDHVNASLQASATHALEHRAGHCSDYHGFCASIGRSLGYPARVTYGINPFPKSSPSHCKLEVYLPPYGWVSFDVSETQKLIADIGNDKALDGARREAFATAARARLLGGFRDNTWFLQTRGTDYELAPPASRKVAVVRTLYAEADGVALPEPDPANKSKREFAWMSAHRYVPDRPVPYPFREYSTLERRTRPSDPNAK